MACDYYKIREFYIYCKNVEYVMLTKCDKNNPFYTSQETLFLKDGKMDIHWVGHSLMKPVEAKLVQRRIDIKEVGEEKWWLWYGDSRRRCYREGIKCQKEDSREPPPMENNIRGNRRWLFKWIIYKITKNVPYKTQNKIKCYSIHYTQSQEECLASWSRIWIDFTNFED